MKKNLLALGICLAYFGGYAQQYAISKEIKVGGDGGWDYLSVNEPAQQLFVSHGSVVNVIDLKSGKTAATINDTNGVHGIAIANDLNKAFISDGKDNAITIVDLTTFALIAKVRIQGEKPDAILYDAFSHKVFAFNGKSNDATVLDAKSNAILATIALNGKPEFSATNNQGLVYVNIEDKNQIKVIDTKSLKVVNTWALASGDEPSGLAIDNVTHRLFSVCGNKLMVVTDAETGKNIAILPIGDGCDGVAFDAKKSLIFSSNGEGTISVVKETDKDHFSVIQTVKTKKGARTITLDKTTGALYLPSASFGDVPKVTPENAHPRPASVPGSFGVLVVEQK